MSAFLQNDFTPCPSRSRSSGSGTETFDSFLDNDSAFDATGQIEFTTEIRPPVLTRSRPRRANRAGSTFQIHDDMMAKPVDTEKRRRPNGLEHLPSERKSSLLAQPAQRFRPKRNVVASPISRPIKQEIKVQPKTQSHVKESIDEIGPDLNERQIDEKKLQEDVFKRNVRRNTVYIPPDDTTMASVFMGLFSPLKQQQTTTLSRATEDTQINTLEAQIAKRQARKSMAASARRAPLQPSKKIAQEAAIRVDVAGKNGGKENIPPGVHADSRKQNKSQPIPLSKPKSSGIDSPPRPLRHNTDQRSRTAKVDHSSAYPPKPHVPTRKVLGEKQSNSLVSLKTSTKKLGLVENKPKEAVKCSAPLNNTRASTISRRSSSRPPQSSKVGGFSSRIQDLNAEYPMLMENAAKPALYEDNWLQHQETIISQLVNSLLECPDCDSNSCGPDTLRFEMIELYQTEFFYQLHKRLQASLSHGALSIPRELLARYTRLRQDVGLRRRFLDIWVQSYELHALVAAAETVVGRKIFHNSRSLESGTNGLDEFTPKSRKTVTRKLEGFLEAFLLRNDDMDHLPPYSRDMPAETQVMAYRRTVLRSIMLVVILDHAKQSHCTSLPQRLFVPTSAFKSSIEILQALASVLLPSCGDMSKHLSHLGCHLTYKQHQLQEYNYQMDNIAVDLRDGIRLTRIIEVLFFTPESVRSDTEDQTEVTLHTGEALSLLGGEADMPLSKHLKYPCASRAAKVYNVQIALAALSSAKGTGSFLNNIRAEDIVDGHREKTLALLWALVSKWGLASLIDWEDARKEITRLKRRAVSLFGYGKCNGETWFEGSEFIDDDEHAQILQHWASILAALDGLSITNLTTSFGNGKIYDSIINEYEPYITGGASQNSIAATGHPSSLGSRLKLLGCSSQFAQFVSPKRSSFHLLDHDFTLGALAFLCSRLLSSSKYARAATVLQRAWRACIDRRTVQRRTVALDLASQCAAAVQTRNEMLWAKDVITRWWRDVRAHKQRRDSPFYQN